MNPNPVAYNLFFHGGDLRSDTVPFYSLYVEALEKKRLLSIWSQVIRVLTLIRFISRSQFIPGLSKIQRSPDVIADILSVGYLTMNFFLPRILLIMFFSWKTVFF